MRGIIDDDVKSVRGHAHSHLGQELCICLAAFEQLNTLSRNEALWQLEIDSNDMYLLENNRATVQASCPCGRLSKGALHRYLSKMTEWGHTTRDNRFVSCRCRRRPNLAVHFAYKLTNLPDAALITSIVA